jgi:hypothetical protein
MEDGFRDILFAWSEDTSYTDLYTMIVEWATAYHTFIYAEAEIKHLLERIKGNDSVIPIVDDFIYGDCYRPIRDQFI